MTAGNLEPEERERLNELLPLVYEQLRIDARGKMAGERRHHTLCPTDLVHQAIASLHGARKLSVRGQAHLRALCAIKMRQILVRHHRGRLTNAQAGLQPGAHWRRISLVDAEMLLFHRPVEIHELEEAMGALEKKNPMWARLIELRFYGGLSDREIGEELGFAPATVKAYRNRAKAWIGTWLNAHGAARADLESQ